MYLESKITTDEDSMADVLAISKATGAYAACTAKHLEISKEQHQHQNQDLQE